jgi:hypothetical protein
MEFGEESNDESSDLGEDNNEAPTRSKRQRTADEGLTRQMS